MAVVIGMQSVRIVVQSGLATPVTALEDESLSSIPQLWNQSMSLTRFMRQTAALNVC